MKLLKLFMTLATFSLVFVGCGKAGSDGGSGADAQSLTIFHDWGKYDQLPLDFRTFSLNVPQDIEYTRYDAPNSPLVICRITVVITGGSTAGRLKTSNGTIVWIRPLAATSACADDGQWDVNFKVSGITVVAQYDPATGGGGMTIGRLVQ